MPYFYFNLHPSGHGLIQLHMEDTDLESARLKSREIFNSILNNKWRVFSKLVEKYCFQVVWYDKPTIDSYMKWDGG